jgi:hypothetical protein
MTAIGQTCLPSSIDDRDVEVTVVDIAVALKCYVEHPEAR